MFFVMVPVFLTGTIYGIEIDSVLKINIVSGLKNDTFDYCVNSEKLLLIEISAGNVSMADSLVFFEITIPIDTSKLQYTGEVVFNATLGGGSNTLTSAGYDPGSRTIYIEAGNSDLKLLAGNLPLVRLQLKSKVQCDDSISIYAKAYFNEEFKKGIATNFSNTKEMIGNKSIVARSTFKVSRNLSTVVGSADTTQVDSIQTTNIPFQVVSGSETKIDSIRTYFRIEKESLFPFSSISLHSNEYELTKIDSFNWFFDYKTSIPFGILANGSCSVTTTGSITDSFKVFTWSKSLTTCDCVSKNDTSSILIQHRYKPPITSVQNQSKSTIEIYQNNGILVVSNNTEASIKSIQIYSLIGSSIYESYDLKKVHAVPTNNMPNGAYIIKVQYENKTETILKYIFNN